MIPLPEDIRPNDINQWLEGGFFFIKRRGKYVVVSLVACADDELLVRDLGGANVWKVDRGDIFPHWPLCGSINVPDLSLAIYVQRNQRRQYRRTFNWRCCTLENPAKWAIMEKVSASDAGVQQGDPRLIAALFEPWYPDSLSEATHKLQREGWGAVALNPKIILAGSEPHPVYYAGEMVGTLSGYEFRPYCDARTAKLVHQNLYTL